MCARASQVRQDGTAFGVLLEQARELRVADVLHDALARKYPAPTRPPLVGIGLDLLRRQGEQQQGEREEDPMMAAEALVAARAGHPASREQLY